MENGMIVKLIPWLISCVLVLSAAAVEEL